MSVVAIYAARAFVVASTTAVSSATGRASAKTPMGKPARSRAVNRRRSAAILMRISAIRHSAARKTSLARAQKQEMKCGASKDGEGNNDKNLVCNEECARLERNRKLALALNIDQSTHIEGGDHVPYSDETLSIFAKHVKWGQTQEREFRVFGTSDEERRLRFKPMKPQERAFLHALANDFGFDSESMDPEPHRHVMIWKTPRFVSAPNKTLAEALRMKTNQRSATASANVSDNESSIKKIKASNDVGEPFNSFIIDRPRFGLTVDELRAELSKLVGPDMALKIDVDFLPSNEVVLRAVSKALPPYDLEQTLRNLKTNIVAAIAGKGYGIPQLCAVDNSLAVLRRESDTASGDGWSRVAAKKAAPRTALQSNSASSSTNSFAALTGGHKVTFAKKKPEKIRPKPVVVVDDWEVAEQAEEAKEKVTSSADEASHLVTPVDEPDLDSISEPSPSPSKPVQAPQAPADDATVAVEQPIEGITTTKSDAQDWASQVEEAGL
ncbi:FKBP12-associated protein [Recurvomyces mirabilis]|uniref:FKBP12-associated protein n=1 Tax=Recurvomyces mirabilis TaxID=574656 RepID=A0AAE1C482_9PEZI|nr:FKBP12-associated protein [Recurvomyces mirabilis]KAK5157374.1 FKBP12-associated protein [Recurvomyces mirabilis]